MTLKLYCDHNVDARVVKGLRRRRIDVLTAAEDGAETWDDETLLKRATNLGRILFSEDSDLIAHASRWQADGQPFAGVIFARQRAVSIGQAIRDLELICQILTVDEMQSRVEYLPL